MKTVIITTGYRVLIDTFNHNLEVYIQGGVPIPQFNITSSKSRWVSEGYYPNLQQCIRRTIFLKSLEGEEVITLQQYIEELDNILGDLPAEYKKEIRSSVL